MGNKIQDNQYHQTLKKFVEICEKNKLWYSLANNSLLSIETSIDYIKNVGLIEIFITFETYLVLNKKYQDNIIESSNSDSFFLITPFFYLKENNKLIKLIIIVPTSIEKIKKTFVLTNRIKYNYSNFLTYRKGYNLMTKIMFSFFKIFSWAFLPIDNREIYDLLFEDEDHYTGFIAINSLNENKHKNWFHNLSFNIIKVDFLNINVNIIQEVDKFLSIKYGQSWQQNPEIKIKNYNYKVILNKINRS